MTNLLVLAEKIEAELEKLRKERPDPYSDYFSAHSDGEKAGLRSVLRMIDEMIEKR